MRFLVMLVVLLATVSICVGVDSPWEVQGTFDAFFPEGDVWDDAMGGEIKGIHWQDVSKYNSLGVAFCAGISQWNAEEGVFYSGGTAPTGTGVTRAYDGDAQYIPLGISLISQMELPEMPKTTLSFEAGLRYMLSTSGINIRQDTYTAGSITGTETHELDDDGIVGRIGASLAWDLNRSDYPPAFCLAGGYQFDLDTGRGTNNSNTPSLANHVADLELDAFYVQIGLVFPLQ